MNYPVIRTQQGIRKVTLNAWQQERERTAWAARERQEREHAAWMAHERHDQHSPLARVLLIDDSATIRKIVTTTLTRAGYETQTFADGIAAMRWLAAPESQLPDLLLVDLGLPKMDGYEVIRRIKGKPQFAQTRCIILSRRDGMLDKLKGRLAGATIYLAKPFTAQALLTAVHTSLSR